eukprot:CCRYP_011451-RA/>CCRYP_011451-RA protein AED:0.19 eAED:0.62 QI:0/-1/0/1/-1/0/1/0/39
MLLTLYLTFTAGKRYVLVLGIGVAIVGVAVVFGDISAWR